MERETEQEIREQWRRAHPQTTSDDIDAEVARHAQLCAAVAIELSLATGEDGG